MAKSLKDGDSATEFTLGNAFTFSGTGIGNTNAASCDYYVDEAQLCQGTEMLGSLGKNLSADLTGGTLSTDEIHGLEAGEYTDCKVKMYLAPTATSTKTDSPSFDIALAKLIVE